eukprot:5820749-Karenia_brevis.AAC.1
MKAYVSELCALESKTGQGATHIVPPVIAEGVCMSAPGYRLQTCFPSAMPVRCVRPLALCKA